MRYRGNYLSRSILSVVLIPISVLVLGEAFTHLYNASLDAGTWARIGFTFQRPLIFGLVAVLQVIMIASIVLMLRPLSRYLADPGRAGEGIYAAARRAALGIPWILIVTTVAFWTAGVIAFYALNDWKSPGGTELGWVLAFKISEGLMSATLNALIVDRILMAPKRALNMERVRPGERDSFARTRDLISVASAMLVILTHLAYVARYYVLRDHAAEGPSDPVFSVVVVGAIVAAVALWMIALSRASEREQHALLISRIREFTTSDGADLRARAAIVNFDETGLLTDAFNGYTESLRSMVAEIRESMATLDAVRGTLGSGVANLKASLDEIGESVSDVGAATALEARSVEESTTSIESIGRNIENLHRVIDDQAAIVTQSSAGIEEMLANIRSVGDNIERVTSHYEGLRRAADAGKVKIGEANSLIVRVSEMSSLLSGANQVIATIAAQTSLLAMNAAIEAAHAGQAGAGFSVVADEIRKLAEKSTGQSKEVGKRLAEVRASIDKAVSASTDAAKGFDEVAGLVDTVSRYEDEIRDAMREQIEGSTQVLEALTAMNGVTTTVKSGAAAMTDGASSLVEGMTNLNRLSERVGDEMKRITADVKSIAEIFGQVSAMIEANAGAIGRVNAQVARFRI